MSRIGVLISEPRLTRWSPTFSITPATPVVDLKQNALDGKPGNLAQYRDKVSLAVNVISPGNHNCPNENTSYQRMRRSALGRRLDCIPDTRQ
jgi:hypothetical protein